MGVHAGLNLERCGVSLQAKLKYAMNDVILDLVSVRKGLNPERINIGLRAFLMIADNLEKNVSS